MADIKNDRRYTNDHEWALPEGDTVRVGITDYAQHELGDIIFVELPPAGTHVEKGKPLGSIEAVKTVAELFSPVTGTVSEVNTKLQENSALVNTDCYGEGWIAVIKPENPAEIATLLDAASYAKLTS